MRARPPLPFTVLSRLLACALLGVAAPAGAQALVADSGANLFDPPDGERPRAEDFETARMVATGLGLRAGAFGTTAVVANPANLALSQAYHMEAFVQYLPKAGVSFGSIVADSSTNRIRAGVATRGIFGSGDRDYRGNEQRLALGTAIGEAIGLGVSARYLRLRSRGQTDDGYPESLEMRRITMDAAIRATPLDGLHFAVLGYSLIRTKNVAAPTQIGGSVVYQFRSVLQVGADFLADLTTFTRTTYLVGGGVEWWAAERYPIRAGYRGDLGRGIHAMSLGLGYVETRFGVELSVRQEFGPYRETNLFLSARYALDTQNQQ